MDATDDCGPLHVVGHFDDPHTGAERSLPELAQVLRGAREVLLWSDGPVHPYFSALGVRALTGRNANDSPHGGSLLIGGVHVVLGDWLETARPRRVLLRYNLPNHQRLFDAIARVRGATGLEPELVFVSQMLQSSVGLPGRIEPSLIRLDALLAEPVARPARAQLTVGRLSRDVIEKHDPQDAVVYRMLAARGIRVRIMGGTCLAPWLGSVPGIELLAAGAEPVDAFLRSLDIFFYRTGSFVEPYGRVVLEAMASGLPVVAAANGGYAEQIRQGEEGLLVQTQEEALRALQLLVDGAELRQRIGSAARNRAIALHGPCAINRLREGYLR